MGGDDARNLFAMGSLLRPLAELCDSTGCTILVVHHCKRSQQSAASPATLDDIAWSGFAEFSAQWLLLSRRRPFDPDRASRTVAHRGRPRRPPRPVGPRRERRSRERLRATQMEDGHPPGVDRRSPIRRGRSRSDRRTTDAVRNGDARTASATGTRVCWLSDRRGKQLDVCVGCSVSTRRESSRYSTHSWTTTSSSHPRSKDTSGRNLRMPWRANQKARCSQQGRSGRWPGGPTLLAPPGRASFSIGGGSWPTARWAARLTIAVKVQSVSASATIACSLTALAAHRYPGNSRPAS